MNYTPGAYADAVLHAVDVQDGFSLVQLLALSSFHGKHGQTPSEIVSQHVRNYNTKRIQISLEKCQGYLKSPWTEILSSQLIVAQRLAPLPPIASNSTFKAHKNFRYDFVIDDNGRTAQDCVREAWEAMNTLVNSILRWFAVQTQGRWALPALMQTLANYRRLSVLADSVIQKHAQQSSQPQKHLEECARQLNKAFSACVADRSTEDVYSRKWGTYEVVGLVFRGYFQLKSLSLCRNILRAIGAADLPPFEEFPRAHKVTFRYYTGVLAFLSEEYQTAESHLTYAFTHCHYSAHHNQEMILQYLIPCRLLRGTLPSAVLLSKFPRLASLYNVFVDAIRSGNVQSYDTGLAMPIIEKTLVKNGTYLAVERAREICLRGLLKRVYQCKDKSSRISIQDFHCALRFVGVKLEVMETEWLVATQIAKGYLRGYISHAHMIAVLSAQNPFPSLQSITVT